MKLQELRFRYDKSDFSDFDADLAVEKWIRRHHLANSIKVVPEVLPGVDHCVRKVEKILGLKEGAVECYLFQSSQVQAYCVPSKFTNIPIVLLSSRVVELLSGQELSFVIGHELGHFLFNHKVDEQDLDENSAKHYRNRARKRYEEISCDRLGCIAVPNIEVAIRALLKSVIGLTDMHIRFDFASVLKQLNDLRTLGGSPIEAMSTHPYFILRIKALLWFQMSDLWGRWKNLSGQFALKSEELDDRIDRELSEISGFDLSQSEDTLVSRACLWGIVLSHFDNGRLAVEATSKKWSKLSNKDVFKAVKYATEYGQSKVREKYLCAIQEIASECYFLMKRVEDYLQEEMKGEELASNTECIEIIRRVKSFGKRI